jgi:hypothetical protein
MTAAELLVECDVRGIRLQALPGDRLDVDGPEELLTDDLLEALRGCKAELLMLLAGGSGDPATNEHGSVAGPQYPTCPACGSVRIAHGLRRLWCIDCETDIGPVDGPQDLPEGDAEGRPERIGNAAPVPIDWPAAAADFCLRLAPGDLPPVPFRLNACTTVSDARRFLRSLQADIERGPSGPRAFYGALQAELIELQQFAHSGQKGGNP